MKLTIANFRGSWAGLPVTWTPQNDFDEDTYRGDVTRCCEIGAPGVYTGGTAGEFYAMELDEFRRVARATVEQVHAAGKPAMIGGFLHLYPWSGPAGSLCGRDRSPSSAGGPSILDGNSGWTGDAFLP